MALWTSREIYKKIYKKIYKIINIRVSLFSFLKGNNRDIFSQCWLPQTIALVFFTIIRILVMKVIKKKNKKKSGQTTTRISQISVLGLIDLSKARLIISVNIDGFS